MRDILRKIPLFSELDNAELDAVAALVSSRDVPKKSVVVHEGEIGESLFIILKGSVKISYYAADGREVVLSLLEEGAFFGEMSLLDRQPRSATVSTMEDSRLAQIRRSDFERLMLEQPALTLKLLSEVVARLRRTSHVLERISTMDVPHRLYDYLRDHCERFGEEDEDGFFVLKLPTHQLLADQLSTSRETISRAISALKKDKIILPVEDSSEVRIDKDALETMLEAFG